MWSNTSLRLASRSRRQLSKSRWVRPLSLAPGFQGSQWGCILTLLALSLFLLCPTQEIDGKSLLLMQRTDVLTGLSIRLGPALKIYEHHIKVLQQGHFEDDDPDGFLG